MATPPPTPLAELKRLSRPLYGCARDIRKNVFAAFALWVAAGLIWLAREGARGAHVPEPYATAGSAIAVGWVLWSFVSATLTRLAALELGAGQEARLVDALGYASSRFFAHVLTVPSMLVAVAVFLAPAALAGLLGRLGPAGLTVASVLFPLALLSAFAAAATAVAFALGSPLVSAGLAVEISSPFDAVSRAFSYLVNAPAAFAAVRLGVFAFGLAAFAVRAVLAFGAATGASFVFAAAAGLPFPRTFWPHVSAGTFVIPAPGDNAILTGALAVFYSYFAAFALSYSCAARVMVYLALRRRVDGTYTWEIAGAPKTQHSLTASGTQTP